MLYISKEASAIKFLKGSYQSISPKTLKVGDEYEMFY